MSQRTRNEIINSLFAHSRSLMSVPAAPSPSIHYSENGYAHLADGIRVRLNESPIPAAVPAVNKLDTLLQEYEFDILRIFTDYFVTNRETVLKSVNKSGWDRPDDWNYPIDDSYLFLLKGGNAIKLWKHMAADSHYPIPNLGDMDCIFLINPRLPLYAFNSLLSHLMEKAHRLFMDNIPSARKIRNSPFVKMNSNSYMSRLRSFDKDPIDNILIPLIIQAPYEVKYPDPTTGNEVFTQITLMKLLLNTIETPKRELIDISVLHQAHPLLGFQYDLYSINYPTLFTIDSPSHMRIATPSFSIAKPIALLYEQSVIQNPSFETRENQLAKRRDYIVYLGTRPNVQNNMSKRTTRNALRRTVKAQYNTIKNTFGKSTANDLLQRNAGHIYTKLRNNNATKGKYKPFVNWKAPLRGQPALPGAPLPNASTLYDPLLESAGFEV